MWLRLTAFAVLAIVSCARAWATSPPVISLDDAFERVARSHPQLTLVDARTRLLDADMDLARQRPPTVAALDLENAFGSGPYRGLSGAEATLSLAAVIERGGKLDARRTLVQSRIDAQAVQREVTRLDLLAETARRYLAAVAATHSARIAAQDVAQRTRTVAAARQRLHAGASPESVLLGAEAALARAELARDRAAQQGDAARHHLAALWGGRDADFDVEGDPLLLPPVVSLAALTAHLDATPELARFNDERRIAEARVQLARSAGVADINWQVGVRRLQESDDTVLVGGISLPLGLRLRAEPAIRAAELELSALGVEREAAGLALYSTLVEAHGRYRLARQEVEQLDRDVLPRLRRAERAAERAYRGGAISYLEWAQLQAETTATRRQQLDAALDAQADLIEIQRLTGQAFVAAPAASPEGTTP